MIRLIDDALKLKQQATQFLESVALESVLDKFGNINYTGSFKHGLMVRREVDICLEMESPTVERLFDLGREIASHPRVGIMLFRNELSLRTEGNPRGIFWCVEYFMPSGERWKVDILATTADEVGRVLSIGENALDGLDDEKREIILKLKARLARAVDAGAKPTSMEVYEAVMDGGITTYDGLLGWREARSKKKPG